MRPNEPLFFANAERILTQARASILNTGDAVHAVILRLEESPDLDSSSLECLHDFFSFVSSKGLRLFLARLKDPAYDIMKSALAPSFPAESLSALSVAEAVHLALADQQTINHPTEQLTGE